MSYSRREVGFVDDLTHRLEKEGFKIWLDYRSLVPGTPWAGQIDKGLEESEVILLVVSKSSMASQYVELEWRRVLKENKRVILLIFEAVDLPQELEQFEWVDFRGNYQKGVKELLGQLQSPVKEKYRAPEKGFKIPSIVWLSAAVGVLVGIFSLFAWWTILVPLILVPLPIRIFKRDFNYVQVQAALWLMPVAIFLTGFNGDLEGYMLLIIFINPLICLVLFLLLRSEGMQRWGKPQATRSKFANLYHPNNPQPKPVSFFIDHSAQDQRIATELKNTLVKYHHPQVADITSAQAVFVLISGYKKDSEANPETQIVFPILVQTAQPSPKLSKVQWIDFRKGVRNLDAIAQLMPDPSRLLAALGVRPTGNQLVLPPLINSAVYFLTVTMVLSLGTIVIDTIRNFSQVDVELDFFQLFLYVCLSGGLVYWMVRTLTTRGGWLAGIGRFTFAYFVLGYLLAEVFIVFGNSEISVQPNSILGIITFFAYILFGIILGFITLTHFRDIRLWMPAKNKK
jgi:hypothetical protein